MTLDELRDYLDSELHPVVSQDNYHLYSNIVDAVDEAIADLAQHQPEERAGRCGCKEGDGWTYGVYARDNLICTDFDGCKQSGCQLNEGDGPACGSKDPKPTWLAAVDPGWGIEAWGTHPEFCPDCGWELDPQAGIARRNAAVGQVARVREALDGIAEICEGPDGAIRRAVLGTVFTIRAALDGEPEVGPSDA